MNKLKLKLKPVLDSVLLGRPVYLCDIPDKEGVAYYPVEYVNDVLVRNEQLVALPVSSDELAEVKEIIDKALDVYQERVALCEKQSQLYEDMYKSTFKAHVKTNGIKQDTLNKDVLEHISVELEIAGEYPKNIDRLLTGVSSRITLVSKLNVEYNMPPVKLCRVSKTKLGFKLTTRIEDKVTKWIKKLDSEYTVTATLARSEATNELVLLGPNLDVIAW